MKTAEATVQKPMDLPILVELDESSWHEKIDAVERWLGNVVMIQAGFCQLAEDVRDKLHEPHFRDLVTEIAETARQHEQVADSLFEAIGREPSRLRRGMGEILSPMRRTWADALGAAGGAAAPFRDLQQLLIASLNAISAFGTAEQLGLAMGIRRLAERSFEVVAEKYPHHLVLQEIALESAATTILYQTELAEPERGRQQASPPAFSAGRMAGIALAGIGCGALVGLMLRSDQR